MKRLVICCDGTWNRADQESGEVPCPTNVIRLALTGAKQDGATTQVSFYVQGVGTGNVLDRWTGGAFGEGLNENIYSAYRFLIGNYEAGDKLYLFGFSRGAFTARSLAGMIRKCGILKRTAAHLYLDAVKLYRGPVHPDDPAPTAFRAQYAVVDPTPIEFIGVWDTVGALGIPLRGLRWINRRKYQFHDVELSGSVHHACQALAIDDRRAPFSPAVWAYVPKEGQTVEQVWFPGVHSDVGGGYGDHRLSDLPLRWMLEQARAAGLALDPAVPIPDPVEALETLVPLHNSFTLLYRLTRPIVRNVGQARSKDGSILPALDPTQSVHASALARWDQDASYRPEGLRAYFRLTGDARANA